MPGVAIATSLMPPLCTAGYGLATLQWQFFFGALYLFFTNMVFILFATWTGVKLMGLRPLPAQDTARARRIQVLVYTIVIATVGVSAYLTAIMLQKSIFMERAAQFVQTEMVFPNTQVLSHREYVERGVRHIDVTLIGDPLPKDSLQLAMTRRLDEAGLGGTRLNIHQGFSIERAQPGPVTNNEEASRMYAIMQSQLAARQNTVDSLSRIIDGQRRVTDAAVRLSPEVRVVFPRRERHGHDTHGGFRRIGRYTVRHRVSAHGQRASRTCSRRTQTAGRLRGRETEPAGSGHLCKPSGIPMA